jgi:hypothetical protein
VTSGAHKILEVKFYHYAFNLTLQVSRATL